MTQEKMLAIFGEAELMQSMEQLCEWAGRQQDLPLPAED